jgi:hypothetical protein
MPPVPFQLQTVPDTIVARVMMPDPTFLEQFTRIAGGILMVAAIGLLAVAVVAAIRLRVAFESARASLEQVGGELHELVTSANRIGADFTNVSETVRTTVDSLGETVTQTNERAQRVVSRLADRVDAFNDALELVQDDTQDVIVTALAALRGVRAGVAALRKPVRKKRRDARPEDDGDDDEPPDLPVRPRLRRRARAAD